MTREEAIQILRTQYPHDAVIKEALGLLIPELRESEDERINKFLRHTFTTQYLCKDKTGKWHGEPVTNILSYLEKQKDLASIPDELVKNYKLFCEQGDRELTLLINTINGFNKLKEPQPAGWSEKDERIVNGIYAILEAWDRSHTAPDGIPSLIPEYCLWLENRLKSLRPSWKPSEEQMEALAYASQVLGSDLSPRAAKAGEELEHLREQLKKL